METVAKTNTMYHYASKIALRIHTYGPPGCEPGDINNERWDCGVDNKTGLV